MHSSRNLTVVFLAKAHLLHFFGLLLQLLFEAGALRLAAGSGGSRLIPHFKMMGPLVLLE